MLVSSTTLAEPFALALQQAILDRDAWPFVVLSPPSESGSFFRHARERHLEAPSPIELALIGSLDSLVRIDAPANTNELAGIDPSLIARAAAARQPLAEVQLAKRWCGTLVPTPALAQQAGMGVEEYAEFVTRALFLDRPDPAAAWRDLSDAQAKLVQRLTPARQIRIEADGTDLTLEVQGRTWINSNGKRNMPSGEVFTGPLERSANGRIRFTVPTGPRGVTVTGVELGFRDGQVVDARAERGEEYLKAALADRCGRLPARGNRDRHQFGDRPRHRPHPARREDGRNGPPRARPLIPRERRDQRLGASLGPDLRSARRRTAQRRR